MAQGKIILNVKAAAKYYDPTVAAGTPDGGTTVTLPDGSSLSVGGAVDSEGVARTLEVFQVITCEDDGTGTGTVKEFCRLFVCSDRFEKPAGWQLIGSGGAFADFWDSATAYAAGSIVQITTATTYGGVTIQPGTYVLRQGLSTSASPTGNQIPQYPYPTSGTIYWICIAMGINTASVCDAGSSGSVYINSSAPF